MIIVSGELMFTSRVSLAAQAQGKPCRVALSAARALDLLAEEPTNLICVDLSAPGVNIGEYVPTLRAANAANELTIVAFAPHVHETKLAAAQAAGCDVVMTRGQFDRSIEELVARA
jgi:CheY-like chemotaxis protein